LKEDAGELKRFDQVPDHIIEEVDKLSDLLSKFIGEKNLKNDPRITMCALNRVHANFIVSVCGNDKEKLEYLTKLEMEALFLNVNSFSEIPIFTGEK